MIFVFGIIVIFFTVKVYFKYHKMFLIVESVGVRQVLAQILKEMFLIHHISSNSAFVPEPPHDCLPSTKDTSKKPEGSSYMQCHSILSFLVQCKLWVFPEGQCLLNGSPFLLHRMITWDSVLTGLERPSVALLSQ